MKKSNAAHDFYSLTYIEFLKLKNQIKLSFTNPLTSLKTIFIYIIPYICILLPLFDKKSKPVQLKLGGGFPGEIISAVLITILVLVLIGTIISACGKYSPTQFTISDVHYLFTSPISSKTIYAWTLVSSAVKGSVGNIAIIILYFIYGIKFFKINSIYFIYVFIGMILMDMFFKTLTYCTYSVSNRFKLENIITKVMYGVLFVFIGYILVSIAVSKNFSVGILSCLNGKIVSNIPAAGWIRNILMSPITFKSPLFEVISLLVLTSIMFFIAVYFADDYYEEAAKGAESRYIVKKAIDEGKLDELQDNKENAKKKVKTVKSRHEYKGAGAFIWKSYISSTRISENKVFMFFLIISLGITVFAGVHFRNANFKNVYGIYTIIIASTLLFVPMIATPLSDEKDKQYMFLLPGRARDKILAMHAQLFLKAIAFAAAITFPILFTVKSANVVGIIAIWISIFSTNILSLYGMLLVTLIMPSFDNGKNSYFVMLIDVLALVPAIVLAIIIAVVTKNPVLSYIIYSLALVLTIFIFYLFTDKLFDRLELK